MANRQHAEDCFLPRAEIEARRTENFLATMALVAERHPHYRRLLAQRKLDPANFSTLDDIAKLPVTTKPDFMAAPDDFVLERDGLPEEMRVIWDVMYTTGTTGGRPTPFVSTAYDFYNILTVNLNMLGLRGVGESDIVANLFPLTRYPHGAFTRAQQAAAVRNIRVVSAMPGNPSPYFRHGNRIENVARIVERQRATILWGVPSFVRRVLQEAERIGADLSAVRMVFVTGEALLPAARRNIAERLTRLGATEPVVSGSYGATEMQGGMVECCPESGFHNPAPTMFLIEIVDPENHEPLPDGSEGLVLLSHLDRRGTVLLRYALGDVSVLSRHPCPHCGATTDRLVRSPRRIDGLVKIKGMLVNPEPLFDRLAAEPGVSRFQLIVRASDPADALSGDELCLRVLAADVPDAQSRERLAALVKSETGITPVIEIVGPEALGGDEGALKEKRLVDQRLKPD